MRCSRCCLTVLLTESKFHWCVRICTHTLSHTLEKHSNDNCKNFHLTVRGEYSNRCVWVCVSQSVRQEFLFILIWNENKNKIYLYFFCRIFSRSFSFTLIQPEYLFLSGNAFQSFICLLFVKIVFCEEVERGEI